MIEKVKVQPKVSHREFVDQLIQVGHLYGWKVAGFRPAQTLHGWRTPVIGDGKGYPDLHFYKPGRVVVVEVKVPPDKLSPEQQEWLDLESQLPSHACYVLTPAEFDLAVAILSTTPKECVKCAGK